MSHADSACQASFEHPTAKKGLVCSEESTTLSSGAFLKKIFRSVLWDEKEFGCLLALFWRVTMLWILHISYCIYWSWKNSLIKNSKMPKLSLQPLNIFLIWSWTDYVLSYLNIITWFLGHSDSKFLKCYIPKDEFSVLILLKILQLKSGKMMSLCM